jgi:cytochrome c oxidase subunit 2
MRGFATFTALLISTSAAAAEFQDALLPAGPQAAHIHTLWLIMLWVCGVVFVAILVGCGMALWRAGRSDEKTPPDIEVVHAPEAGLRRVVAVGAGVSILGLVALTLASIVTDRALAGLPLKDGIAIEVTANQWWWDVKYEGDKPSEIFHTANEIHVPVGKPVVIKLNSRDVIHSFWVPNLHGKKDLIPGRTALLQFRADKAGIYRGQCAEFCGYQHAKMAFLVIAMEPGDYDRWLQAQRRSAPEPADDRVKRGQQVFLGSTCIMCHAVQGTSAHGRTAPDLTHLASRQTIAAGTLANTRGNLAGWILDPQSVKPGVNMPAHSFAPDDLNALLDYLESLK